MAALVFRALWELIRYDVVNAMFGFREVQKALVRYPVAKRRNLPDVISAVTESVALAACFYWRPVLCQQRAVAATRMLRKRGIQAQFVIGYRPTPFFSHAWVEVDGRVVNDSPSFKQRLQVLYTA